jgi:hypothetical protein
MPEKQEKSKTYSMEYDRHEFTDEEKLAMSKDLSRIYGERDKAENELKAIKSDFKSRLDRMSADLGELATKLQNGYEMRRVKCEVNHDYKKKRVYFYRVDTGALVKDRAMFQDELQMKLDDFGKGGGQ